MSNSYKYGQWYSVTDNEIPEEYDWVLVSFVDFINENLRFVPHVAERRKGKWASQENDNVDLEEWLHVKVTHWMPLPDSPKE